MTLCSKGLKLQSHKLKIKGSNFLSQHRIHVEVLGHLI